MSEPAQKEREEISPDIRPDIPGIREQENGFYNPVEDDPSSSSDVERVSGKNYGGFYNNKGGAPTLLSGLKKRKKSIALGAFGVTVIVTAIVSLFVGIGSLNLTNFMSNIERKGFLRYQVDMNDRSSKWINTYMALRFAEVEDPRIAVKDRENIMFQAARIDNNQPLKDWYKTLRSSSFEDEVFKKHGIIFTSVAQKKGNIYTFRTAILTINDKQVEFTHDLTGRELTALGDGDVKPDINRLNGRLSEFFDQGEHMRDKDARNALRVVLKEEYPRWWQSYKRHYLRQDMQNRLGIRKWMFFETSRHKLSEGVQDRRNKLVGKVIASTTPAGGASGRFLECLFGLNNCSSPRDAGHPEITQLAEIALEEAAEEFFEHEFDLNGDNIPDGKASDATGEVIGGIADGLNPPSSDVAGQSALTVRKSIARFIKTTNVVTLVDLLMRFSNTLAAGKLSSIIASTKSQYAMGLYATFKIADDQMKTGEMNSDEFGDFMGQYGNLNNGEAWSSVVDSGGSSSLVSAVSDSFTPSDDKAGFCDIEHQEEIKKPENKAVAEKEYQYLCPQDRIGSKNNARELEDLWNETGGLALNPIAKVWGKTISKPIDWFNSAVGAVLDPVVNTALAASGQEENLENGIAWIAEKALELGGANMNIDATTPSGRVGNLLVQGSSATSEMASRMSGAALTTNETALYSSQRVLAYQTEELEGQGVFERYASLSNHRSFLSMQIPRIASVRYEGFKPIFSGIASSIATIPHKILSLPVSATEEDGYAAANFAGIDTYDFPPECINSNPLDMTLENSTNADELGLIPASELSWDLMTSKKDWYSTLYEKEKDESKVMKVWNCALLDDAVRGGIGSIYGYRGKGYYESSSSSSNQASSEGDLPGDEQQLAKDILASKNIQFPWSYVKQDIVLASRGKPGTCNKPMNVEVLQFILALAKNNTITITGLQDGCSHHSEGSDHYSGNAVDLDLINGKEAYSTITDYYDEFAPYVKNAVFLQGDCSGAKKAPAGMNRANGDSCTHQHVSFK